MTPRAPRHVYGPVPSRRLGRSLGVDLVPFKTCTYDCVYCQLGRTTNKTTERREYVPVDGVLDELAQKLRLGSAPDYIGLAGSGEPTLHARLGELIAGIKQLTRVPVAVLTNGSMLWAPEVRDGLAQADLVLPSLDAGTRGTFERVNRPHPEISFEKMVEGLVAFRESFAGQVWLEVFVLGGISDPPEEIGKIAELAGRVRPDRVQLNTVSRPPAEDCALAVPAARLEQLRGRFAPPCEVIAEPRTSQPSGSRTDGNADANAEQEIVALLRRRPCTVAGLAEGLGLAPNEVVKLLDTLVGRGEVRLARVDGATYAVTGARPLEKEDLT